MKARPRGSIMSRWFGGLWTHQAPDRAGWAHRLVPTPPEKREAIEQTLRHFGLKPSRTGAHGNALRASTTDLDTERAARLVVFDAPPQESTLRSSRGARSRSGDDWTAVFESRESELAESLIGDVDSPVAAGPARGPTRASVPRSRPQTE